ncbi:MAG: DUF4440 domain-containing protein [Nevskia sp.]|nr:DUF4440 domain-containing protein [Nevskia sp.]
MRQSRLRSAALVLLAAALPAYAAETGIAAIDAQWIKAVKAGDADAAAGLYANDAILWIPGAPMAKGAKAIHDAYQGWLSATTIQDVKLTLLGGSTKGAESVGWGTFSITSAPKSGGATTTEVGRYTEVGKRVGGKWVYVVDHASDDPAPTPGK